MDTICWGKATVVREPSNEHNPYTVAVLENVGGGGEGGGEEQQVAVSAPLASVL